MQDFRTILPTFNTIGPSSDDAPMFPNREGIGKLRLFALSPVVSAMRGLGDDPVIPGAPATPLIGRASGTDVVWAMVILGLVGAASYQAGKAIAPSHDARSTWGWIGVPVGLFTGVLGLGIMGYVANGKKA
jgi:hypothetical protein